jgi:hypothetical protein
VEAEVAPGAGPVVAHLRFDGLTAPIALERAPASEPFRWYVSRSVSSQGIPPAPQPARRPCGSLVGVLSALRRLLDIDAGAAARVLR